MPKVSMDNLFFWKNAHIVSKPFATNELQSLIKSSQYIFIFYDNIIYDPSPTPPPLGQVFVLQIIYDIDLS